MNRRAQRREERRAFLRSRMALARQCYDPARGGKIRWMRISRARAEQEWSRYLRRETWLARRTEPIEDHLEDLRQPRDPIAEVDEAEHVRFALALLKPRERMVVTLVLLEGWTNREVATLLDVGTNRVCELRKTALSKLRRWANPGKFSRNW